jgi:hypothetical protein
MKNSDLKTIDLANELKRLALNVARDIRRDSELTCLSNLTAMQPLQSLLLQTLTAHINVISEIESEPKVPFGFAK